MEDKKEGETEEDLEPKADTEDGRETSEESESADD